MVDMPRGPDAIANPKLLVWARESVGLSIEEVALKIKKDAETIIKWETGEAKPTVAKLRDLARIYKRPLAIFYLSKPPKSFKPLNDYRRLLGDVEHHILPELRFAIRDAYERRELVIELYEEIESEILSFPLKAKLNDDPEILAVKIRNILKADIKSQSGLREGQAFNYWRDKLENHGVLTFQAPGINTQHMRGFSISEFPFPVIVVNIKDKYGRIFTLFHELTHILLHESGICDLRHISDLPLEKREVEILCNHVAGAVLVPKDILLNDEVVIKRESGGEWKDNEINLIARKFTVSREVILRRLLIFGKTSNDFYEYKREQYQKEFLQRQEKEKKQQKEIRIPRSVLIPARTGHLFIRLILNSYYQDKITLNDVSDYFNVKIKHISKIEEKVFS